MRCIPLIDQLTISARDAPHRAAAEGFPRRPKARRGPGIVNRFDQE
ncbi:MAG: hypothetical protein ACJ8J0_09635 [Longimicrobiaceae bacterium]